MRLLVLPFLLLATPALAVDGVIEINQAAALAGGVTPGDAPGFPVTLSERGSYRLTGNLVANDSTSPGILIDAGRVTIDLNGFTVFCQGCGPPQQPVAGIEDTFLASGGRSGSTVENGSVFGWHYAVHLGESCRVRDIEAGGEVVGIKVGSWCDVSGNRVGNGAPPGPSIIVLDGCTVTGNRVNTWGISARNFNIIKGNTFDTASPFSLGSGNVVEGNTCGSSGCP